MSQAFAIWITGLPASGKSTLAARIAAQLKLQGLDVAILESDELRRVFVKHPRYDEEERDTFYEEMAYVGVLLTRYGVPVIFDATANRRSYRERARQQIPHFLEVYVATPLAVCMARDPKGIYRKARAGKTSTVPGLQAPYEAPESPDIVVDGDRQSPDSAAQQVVAMLSGRGYIGPR